MIGTQGQSVYGSAGTSVYGGGENTSKGSTADRFGAAPKDGQSALDREGSTEITNVSDGSDNDPPQPSPFGFNATAVQRSKPIRTGFGIPGSPHKSVRCAVQCRRSGSDGGRRRPSSQR